MPPRRFSTRTLLIEGLRNSASSRVRSLISMILTAAISFAIVAVSFAELSSIESRSSLEADLGSNSFSVTAQDRVALSGTRCEELATLSGVMAVGGVESVAWMHSTLSPGYLIQEIQGTAGLTSLYWPSTEGVGSDSVVGDIAATRLGLVDGAKLPLATGPVLTVGTVAKHSVFNDEYDSSVFVAVPASAPIYECDVRAAPGARASVEATLVGWFGGGVKTFVAPLYVDQSTAATPAEQLAERYSQYGPPLGALILIGAALLGWVSRRAEFALYRLLGATRPQLAYVMAAEFFSVTAAPIAVGLLAALLIFRPQNSLTLTVAGLDALRFIALLLIAPAAGALAVSSASTVDQLKGR
jgi:hypothetical protein